jgi:predicted RNA binding protein YcfA (HicA-like mRNA interferase family)
VPPTPRLTFRQIERILRRHDFSLDHVRGSHHYYVNDAGRIVLVARHGNKVIPLGTMRSIMKQSGLPDDAWS